MELIPKAYEGSIVKFKVKHFDSRLYFDFDSETETSTITDDSKFDYESHGYHVFLDLDCKGHIFEGVDYTMFPKHSQQHIQDIYNKDVKLFPNIKEGNCDNPYKYFPSKEMAKHHVSKGAAKTLAKIKSSIYKGYKLYNIEKVDVFIIYMRIDESMIDSIKYVYMLMGWSRVCIDKNKIEIYK